MGGEVVETGGGVVAKTEGEVVVGTGGEEAPMGKWGVGQKGQW